MTEETVARPVRLATLGGFAVSAVLFLLAGTASAATFHATDATSFATAVQNANSSSGANTIVLATGVYNPTSTVVITNTSGPQTIQGPTPNSTTNTNPAHFTGNALTSPMPGASVFLIGPGVTVNFDNIDITTAGSAGNGVIDDSGIVSLNQTTITGQGPGLTIETGGVGTMLNSTISDGLDVGIIDNGTLTLTNSTVTRSPNGGIDNQLGTLNLVNSIVAKNGSPDCTAPANTSDHSLDGDGTCGVGSLSSKNPMLAAISLRGGSTPTDIPLSGSPAIDAGDPAMCPSVDERGAGRPDVVSTPCDLGAVETYYGVQPVLTNTNVKAGSTSASGTVVNYTPTWNAGSPVTSVSCAPASGSTFPVGQTTVTCTGTDSVFGATGTGTFTVTDVQAAPPTVTTNPPGTDTVAAPDSSGATVTFTASATDPIDGTDPVTCVPASGTKFPIGDTTVTCTASDSSGLTGTATLTVTVTAPVAPPNPTLTLPSDMTVAATSSSGAVVTFTPTPTAADPDGGAPDPVTCTPPSGSTFPVTTTLVTCSATDREGGSATGTFNVKVEPGASPVITKPADMSVAATMPGGAQVTFTVTATDPIDGTDPVTCTPASGSTFPIGNTVVDCTATDSLHNTSTATFNVTVTQSTPPTIVVPANITAAATSAGGAKVSFAVTATDPVNGALTAACTPASGATFPVGTTTVSCTATDSVNLSASGSFTVTVPPPSAPVITVPAFRVLGALTSAGDAVTYTVTATDQIDKTDPVTCSPPSGATFPIGTTTVMCTATDSGGRTSTASFDIEVDPPLGPSSPSAAFSLPKPTVKGDVATVKLNFPSAGRVVVLETLKKKVKGGKIKYVRFATVSKHVAGGSKKIALKLNKTGLASLAGVSKSSSLTVTVAVTFTPTGGKAHTERSNVKLRGLKP